MSKSRKVSGTVNWVWLHFHSIFISVYNCVHPLQSKRIESLHYLPCAVCQLWNAPTCSFTFTFMTLSLSHTRTHRGSRDYHMMMRLESMYVALQWCGCHYHVLPFFSHSTNIPYYSYKAPFNFIVIISILSLVNTKIFPNLSPI